jgi:hypothetical protein
MSPSAAALVAVEGEEEVVHEVALAAVHRAADLVVAQAVAGSAVRPRGHGRPHIQAADNRVYAPARDREADRSRSAVRAVERAGRAVRRLVA